MNGLRPATRSDRVLGIWLSIWAGMLFVLILIGGGTRLTESGLSITEWKPVSGVIPPLTAEQWDSAFARYRAIPQYAAVHPDMTVEQFKGIYLWEYTHRLWARLVGAAFLVPLLIFLARGMVPPGKRSRLWLLIVLLGLQGALGWFMVSSGLSGRIEVSQYRLAAHLAAALLIYGATIWMAADFLDGRRGAGPDAARVHRGALVLTAMAVITAIAGAFVAGLRAGKIFNTFPLMAGRIVPPGYGALSPWIRNPFDNPAAAQFDHRILALSTGTAILIWWAATRRQAVTAAVRRLENLFALAVIVQVTLGILTLLHAVPIPLGVAHQAGAVLLITIGILLVHRTRPARD